MCAEKANSDFLTQEELPEGNWVKTGIASTVPTEPTLWQWFGHISSNRSTNKIFEAKLVSFQ